MEANLKPFDFSADPFEGRLQELAQRLCQHPSVATLGGTEQTLKQLGEKLEDVTTGGNFEELKQIYFEALFEIDAAKRNELLDVPLKDLSSSTNQDVPPLAVVDSSSLWTKPSPPSDPGDEVTQNNLYELDQPMQPLAEGTATEPPIRAANEERTLPHIQPDLWEEEELTIPLTSDKEADGMLASETAQHLKELDTFLQAQKEYLAQSPLLIHLEKLILQVKCLTVEAEAKELLQPYLQKVWQERTTVLSASLTKQAGKIDVSASLKKALQALAQRMPDLKMSMTGILNSFRYLSALEDLTQGKFTLYDYGVLLLTLGHASSGYGFEFKNLFQISVLTDNETIDAGLAFLKLQRLKMRVASFEPTLERELVAEIEKETEKLLHTLRKMKGEHGLAART